MTLLSKKVVRFLNRFKENSTNETELDLFKALSNTSIRPVYPALSVTVARIRLCDFVSNGFNPKDGLELRTSVNKDLSFKMDSFMVFLSCVKQPKKPIEERQSLPMGIKKVQQSINPCP